MTLSIKIGGSGWAYYQKSAEERGQAFQEAGAGRDYYGTDLARPGVWMETKPGICAEFGLQAGGLVTDTDMMRVVDEGHQNFGLVPGFDKSGQPVMKRSVYNSKNKQIDQTFSVPKSISALWADSDPATRAVIEQSCRNAALESLKAQAANGLWVNRGSTPATQHRIKAEGLAAASYLETTNRDGEPQLHVHMVASTIVKGEDGKFSRIYSRALFGEGRASDAQGQAWLRADLSERLGVAWEPTDVGKGTAEIAGIDPERLAALSQRTARIDTETDRIVAQIVADTGEPPTKRQLRAIRQRVTLETRATKHQETHATPATIEKWQADYDKQTGTTQPQRWDRLKAVWAERGGRERQALPTGEQVVDAAMAENATATESWLRRTGWAMVPSDTPAAKIRDVAAQLAESARAHFVQLTPQAAIVDGYTTANLVTFTSEAELDLELSTVATVETSTSRDVGTARAATVEAITTGADAAGRRLSPEQADAVRHLTSPGLLKTMIAPAGSGKTFTTAQAVRAWQAEGKTVVVLGNSADSARVAADEIAAAAGGARPVSMTLAAFHGRGPMGMGQRARELRDQLAAGDAVVVLDEAGTANNRDFADLVTFADRYGAALRAVGDPAQQGAMGPTGLWEHTAQLDGVSCEISEVRRFDHPEEAEVSKRLRAGDATAWDWYIEQGRIVMVPDRETAIAAAAAHAAAERDAGRDCLAIATSDKDREDLAAGITALDEHRDERPTRTYGNMEVAQGDTVRARLNNAQLRDSDDQAVMNGSTWTVLDVKRRGIKVQREGSDATAFLPRKYVASNIEPQAAITNNRVQGATVDTSTGVGLEDTTREQAYVKMTRARDGHTEFVVAHNDADLKRQLADVTERIDPRTSALDAYGNQLREHADRQAQQQQEEAAKAERDPAQVRAAYYERDQVWRGKPDNEIKQMVAVDSAYREKVAAAEIKAAEDAPVWDAKLPSAHAHVEATAAELREAAEAKETADRDLEQAEQRAQQREQAARAEVAAAAEKLQQAQQKEQEAGRFGKGAARAETERVKAEIDQTYPGAKAGTYGWKTRAESEAARNPADGRTPAQERAAAARQRDDASKQLYRARQGHTGAKKNLSDTQQRASGQLPDSVRKRADEIRARLEQARAELDARERMTPRERKLEQQVRQQETRRAPEQVREVRGPEHGHGR